MKTFILTIAAFLTIAQGAVAGLPGLATQVRMWREADSVDGRRVANRAVAFLSQQHPVYGLNAVACAAVRDDAHEIFVQA